jgi:hypothetical protein
VKLAKSSMPNDRSIAATRATVAANAAHAAQVFIAASPKC